MHRWVGKIAMVTGSSRGIGRAITKSLVKEGLIVAGLARKGHMMDTLKHELSKEKGQFHAFSCDISKGNDLVNTFKRIEETLGPISVMVNNAGIAPPTDVIDGDIDTIKQIIDTNLVALTICTREAIDDMKKHNIKGHIININSLSAHMYFDVVNFSIYSTTKSAVNYLTESVRREINRKNLPIKITSISPGFVETDILTEHNVNRPSLKCEDVADSVLYTLSTPEHVNVKELTLIVQGALV